MGSLKFFLASFLSEIAFRFITLFSQISVPVKTGNMKKIAVDWTQLPRELLEPISKKLTVYRDYVRCRAVCLMWRRSIPRVPHHLPTQLPWLMLPRSRSQPRCQLCFYDLSTDKTHHFELPEASNSELRICSSNGWLVILEDSPVITLLNPLTRAKFYLPPLNSFPNVLSFDYSKVRKEYVIEDVSHDVFSIYRQSLREMRDGFIEKIVLSSYPLNNNFVALAILNDVGLLASYKNGDLSWNFLPAVDILFCDATYYKGQFYAVGDDGRLMVCDINGESSTVSDNISPRAKDFECHKVYLVNSEDKELLMVVPHLNDNFDASYETLRFDVFKMNWSEPSWERVENLGDRLLFIGGNSSVALSSYDVRSCLQNLRYLSPCDDYGQCLGSCIYFTDDLCQCYFSGNEFSCYNVGDRGIFKLWDESIIPLPCREEGSYAPWIALSPC